MLKENLVEYFRESIRKNWDLAAFSDYQKQTVTYKDVGHTILRLHYIFQASGIKKGDKIALLGRNCTNWAISYLAVVTYGAAIVPILPDFKPDDVHHIVNHSDSVLLISSSALYEDLDETSMIKLKGIISLDDFSLIHSEDKHMKSIVSESHQKYREHFGEKLTPKEFGFDKVPNEEIAALVYTSGTTGFSKGVMLSHNNIVANVVYAQNNMPLSPGDTIVSFLPIAHVFGCVFEFIFPFTMGCHITFLGKIPSPKIILKAFQEIHPRLILSVPLVIEKIYRKQIKPTISKTPVKILSKLPFIDAALSKKINAKLTESFGGNFREIVIGGAPLNEEVEEFLRKIGFKFTIGYGMTECAPLISYSAWDKFKLGSAGKIVDTMELKINSDDPYNEVGEILVRGENVMNGYYKNEKASKEAIDEEGWLHTGDLGHTDEDNVIYIKGRCKSMILGPSGKNIYPEELEAKLNNMPLVQESLVIGRDNKLIALIYLDMETVDKEGISETELAEIMENNKKELNKIHPAYMNISKVEIFPEEFEKTPKRSIKRFLYNH